VGKDARPEEEKQEAAPRQASDPPPVGLPDAKSSARLRTPVPEEPRPPGLTQMTPSARMRLELVLDEDDSRSMRLVPAPKTDPKKPPKSIPPISIESAERKTLRSLARWVALCGLMTLTVGALTGLSYFTGEGKVAHVVVGILASALSFWLLLAAIFFGRAGSRDGARASQHLASGFSLLRSAFLLKAVLLFSAMALGCFTFSLAASLLFLL
jgi:hypothetical protein